MEHLGPQKMWKEARKMTGQNTLGSPTLITEGGKNIQSPSQLAELFNKFYIDKLNKIRSLFKHPINDPAAGLRLMVKNKNLENTFKIQPIGRPQLHNILKDMNATKSAGLDGISMKLVKEYQSILEPALLNIVNQSITHNTFPSTLKTSKVNPIQKPDQSSNLCGSFRPINILQSTSKVSKT